jgi:hypothetical protein
MAQVAVLVCLTLLTITACGKSDPKTLLVGQWRENLQSEKWAGQSRPVSGLPTCRVRCWASLSAYFDSDAKVRAGQ